MYLGVELELDNGGEITKHAERLLDIANFRAEHMYIKHDGSIEDGFELVTHPVTLEYHQKEMPWKRIFEQAIARVVYFVEAHWNELLKFSRRTPTNVMRWASRYGIAENTQLTYDKAKKGNMGRYVCINLQNEETIEFRIFRGTLKYETFIATLQLVHEICKRAASISVLCIGRCFMHIPMNELIFFVKKDYINRYINFCYCRIFL